MSRTLLLFNGPPSSGKDTAAYYAWRKLPNTMLFKASRPLKEGLAAFFGLSPTALAYLETNKEEKSPVLFGHSWREVQISLSETWAKPLFGTDVFGHLASRWLFANLRQIAICSDSGFTEEVETLIKDYRPTEAILVRLHRPGMTFANDSRSYIFPANTTKTLDVYNTGSLSDFHAALDGVFVACGLMSDN